MRRRGRWVREGVGLRVSSTVRHLINYLQNCCIYNHLNKHLSEYRKSGLVAAKSAPRPSLLSCSSSCSSFPRLTNSGFFFAPPPLFLSSSDNELSLMQIYSHVIPQCLPSADSRSIAQHHASKMSSLLHLASLDSQSWLASPSFTNLSSEVINAVFGPWWLQLYFVWASICESRVSSNTGAKSSVDWHHVKKSPYSSRLTRLGLPSVVMGF